LGPKSQPAGYHYQGGFFDSSDRAVKKQNDKEKIEFFRKDYIKTLEQYAAENILRMDYLITAANK
jgi:hypothetical protein